MVAPNLAAPTATSSKAVRGRNFLIAATRFGRNWTRGDPSNAMRHFWLLWPVWTGGSLLIVLSAWLLDAPSVGWARELPPSVIGFFEWLTRFGQSDWLLISLGLTGLVLLLADWRSASRRIAAAWTEIGIIIGFAFLSIVGSGILVNILKQLIGRGRPIVFDQDGAFSFLPFQFDFAHASFPSGHSTTMGALAVVVAVIAPRLRVLAMLICALVAASRVVVGAHYPSDVAAGFLLGVAYTWFYALALAYVGIGFALGAGGPITARVVAVRKVFRRPHGLLNAIMGLLYAIVGGRPRTVRG